MNILAKISRAIDLVAEIMGWVAMILVLLTVVIGFYNVVARYIGFYAGVNLSSNSLLELQWYLFSIVFFLGFAYNLKHGINVRVDFYYAHWTPQRKAWIDLIGHLLFLVPFCLLAIYVTYGPVMTSWGRLPSGEWGNMEMSPDPGGLPRAPIKSMIIVAFVLLLAQTFSELIKLGLRIAGKEKEAFGLLTAEEEAANRRAIE